MSIHNRNVLAGSCTRIRNDSKAAAQRSNIFIQQELMSVEILCSVKVFQYFPLSTLHLIGFPSSFHLTFFSLFQNRLVTSWTKLSTVVGNRKQPIRTLNYVTTLWPLITHSRQASTTGNNTCAFTSLVPLVTSLVLKVIDIFQKLPNERITSVKRVRENQR